MLLGQAPEYALLSAAIGHEANVAHYANVDLGSIRRFDAAGRAATRRFVKECARFVFDNFSNVPYPPASSLVSRLYDTFSRTAVPRPNHGAGNHMRQLLFGLLTQTQMAQSCPRSYASILLLGSGRGLSRESALRRYLALSVAPLFYQVGRVSEAASQAMAVDQRDGSYMYVYRDVMGCRDARLLARLQKRFPQKLMNSAIVVSFAAYRAVMRCFLDPAGADADFGRFLSYVAAAGVFYLNHAPPDPPPTSDALHAFILLNELTMSGHYFDHCRGDFSMMLAPFGPYSHRGSGEYLLKAMAAEDAAFDEAAFRAEMEAAVIVALSLTLDIAGDTSGVQCHKAPTEQKQGRSSYPTVRSLRSYADTPERIALLTDFERVFHALFTRRGAGVANIALPPDRLNPTLRAALRRRSVKVDMDANLLRLEPFLYR
jgi:hypothetical protein